MLTGHVEASPRIGSEKDLLLRDRLLEVNAEEEDGDRLQVLYTVSFDELASKVVQYDTILWLLISLILVLAWGIGIIMLLYIPYRRYVLRKCSASQKLYVTPREIIYKVRRPSFIPFCGERKIVKHVPLSLVIDVIVEQGCLQSVYGLHTFRVESISLGKAAPVDELQVQGVHSPGLLRKIVVKQASKAIQDAAGNWELNSQTAADERIYRMESLTLGPAVLRSPSKGWQAMTPPRYVSIEPKSAVPTDLVLDKLEQVKKSVRKLEFLVEKTHSRPSAEEV